MTRHSRNCTANSVYSYHEKSQDARASGFGSLKMRFAKGAIKDFDCCCISLHPCINPVVTQEGFLFDKESILEYIVTKKNENSKQLKEYEKQCKKEQLELEELGAAEHRSKVERFTKGEASVTAASQAAKAGPSAIVPNKSKISKLSNMAPDKAKHLPSFWVPTMTPHSTSSKINKPSKAVLCPMSGKVIKMKDLFPVKFTQINESEEKIKLEGKNERYKCPVSGDVLRNNVPVAVIKTTGDVITIECVKLIQKDWIHPLNGETLKESDIIYLQRGGTGFAETNDVLTGKMARPVMQT